MLPDNVLGFIASVSIQKDTITILLTSIVMDIKFQQNLKMVIVMLLKLLKMDKKLICFVKKELKMKMIF